MDARLYFSLPSLKLKRLARIVAGLKASQKNVLGLEEFRLRMGWLNYDYPSEVRDALEGHEILCRSGLLVDSIKIERGARVVEIPFASGDGTVPTVSRGPSSSIELPEGSSGRIVGASRGSDTNDGPTDRSAHDAFLVRLGHICCALDGYVHLHRCGAGINTFDDLRELLTPEIRRLDLVIGDADGRVGAVELFNSRKGNAGGVKPNCDRAFPKFVEFYNRAQRLGLEPYLFVISDHAVEVTSLWQRRARDVFGTTGPYLNIVPQDFSAIHKAIAYTNDVFQGLLELCRMQ